MRSFVLAVILSIAVAPQSAMAGEPLPPQAPKPIVQSPQSQPALSQEQITHLKAAAEHLAKAGRKEEARKLQEQAAAAESGQAAALLAKKEKELTRLQAEVGELRKLARRQPQISIAFQVLQLSRERLKEHDIPNLKLIMRKDAGTVQLEVIENPAAVAELVDDLRKRGLVKVLAEPMILTVSGRPAHFHAGGELPMPKPGAESQTSLEYLKFGTEIDAVPLVVGDDKVRLELRLRVAEVDPARAVMVRGVKFPNLRSYTVDTAAEMRLGQTLVLGGTTEKRVESVMDEHGKVQADPNHIETIVLVTPRRVDGTEPVILPQPAGYYSPAPRAAMIPAPLNFGGVTPRVIHTEEEEENLIIQEKR
jgi:hypothetical protein